MFGCHRDLHRRTHPYPSRRLADLFAKKDDNIKSAKDLSGLRIGVARASTQDVAVTKIAPKDANIRRFDDDASAMQALMSGQVDAIGCSTTVAAQIAKRQQIGRASCRERVCQSV